MEGPCVLVAAPLPPPITGQSVVTEMAVQVLREHAPVVTLDTTVDEAPVRDSAGPPVGRALRWVSHLARLRALLRSSAPDVFYFTPASSVRGLLRDRATLALVPASTRVVAHFHVANYDTLLRHRVWGRAASDVLGRLDAVVLPSAYAANRLLRAAPDVPAHVVPNVVPSDRRVQLDELEAKWTRSSSRKRSVLFLANLLPEKGHELLADALVQMNGDAPDHVVVAGAWPSADTRAQYESRLRVLGLADSVEVTGALTGAEVRERLLEADVFVFPSTCPSESFGLSLLEGMHAGCAAIAVDHAAAGELVHDGVEGRLVAPTAGALAAGLADAQRNAERFGRAAASRARAAYGAERFEDELPRIVLGLS
ncbi:MAG: glycosyltransferase family 4 protein [Bacteroidota bacterium]